LKFGLTVIPHGSGVPPMNAFASGAAFSQFQICSVASDWPSGISTSAMPLKKVSSANCGLSARNSGSLVMSSGLRARCSADGCTPIR
jgi:hypothetical protein